MLDALRQYVSGYAQLTDAEFDSLSGKIEIREFGKKQQLIGIGEIEPYLNLVVKGLVRKYFFRGQEELVTQIAKEFDLINSSVSFLDRTPSTYVVETIEPSILLSITKENLEDLYAGSHKMEHLGRLIVTQLFLQKEEWDHERMRLNTRDRFVNFVKNNSDLLQRVPQKYLASYLNIKPETFSRLKHLLLLRKKK
jgi:signal-transduction protein with cAMP-binding, CBS, and nucleotidyltransferase domain